MVSIDILSMIFFPHKATYINFQLSECKSSEIFKLIFGSFWVSLYMKINEQQKLNLSILFVGIFRAGNEEETSREIYQHFFFVII